MAAEDDRYMVNEFSLEDAPKDYGEFTAKLMQFVTDAQYLLEEALNDAAYHEMDLYVGKVGIAMTLARINRTLGKEYTLPILTKESKNSDRSMSVLGFCSSYWSLAMYNSLRTGKTFSMPPGVYGHNDSIPDELLYGRAGLALMVDYFTKKGLKLARPHLAQDVLQHIAIPKFPWTWHNKVYYGGAHGTSGILLTLKLLAGISLPDQFMRLLQAASLPSGNFRSSQGSRKDELVQWCHGATGFIPLLLAYREVNLEVCDGAIDKALEVIWQRGLLRKGCGICHGIAGNGYAFLTAFIKTGDKKHLSRALIFASFIIWMGASECCANADRPCSLFEGLAGAVQFLLDVVDIITMNSQENLSNLNLFDGLSIF